MWIRKVVGWGLEVLEGLLGGDKEGCCGLERLLGGDWKVVS